MRDLQPDCLKRSAAAMPFETGMLISVTMRSGSSRIASSNSLCPSATLATTLNCGCKTRSAISGKFGWSSARMTRILCNLPRHRSLPGVNMAGARGKVSRGTPREKTGKYASPSEVLLR